VNVQTLIESVVRQTTVLIAQLATSGGLRAPLSDIAGQVFLTLAREIEDQGISRKVSADMFGMALRTYQRRTQRLRESSTDHGRSLWEAVFEYIGEHPLVTRHEVLVRFHRDDEALVRGVLHDLTESGLVFSSGTGVRAAYRVASEDELGRIRKVGDDAELDALIWALVYREGPIAHALLQSRSGVRNDTLDACLQRLLTSGRIARKEQNGGAIYSSSELVIGLEETTGWEAAVLDHFQAMVRTVCQKLGQEPTARAADTVGGSTYTFVVWDGHPLERDVYGHLARFRKEQSELRQRVDAHNKASGIPARHARVVTYGGQHVIQDESDDLAQEKTDDATH
jgi:hypothetical protein